MSILDKLDFGGLGGAVSDIFGAMGAGDLAKGYKAQATGYRGAAEISGINRGLAAQANAIQAVKTDREVYRALGGQVSDVAASGFSQGSATDLIRDSAQQGALAKQIINRQGAIEQNAYMQEQQSYLQQAASADASAAAAKKQKKGGIFGGILKAVGVIAPLVIASDDDLKEDIKLVERREDGLGIYTFRYNGQQTLFKGVLASEVQALYPAAVSRVDGHRAVDYEMIGVIPEVVNA